MTLTSPAKITDGSLHTLAPYCGYRSNKTTNFHTELYECQPSTCSVTGIIWLRGKVINLLDHCRKTQIKIEYFKLVKTTMKLLGTENVKSFGIYLAKERCDKGN